MISPWVQKSYLAAETTGPKYRVIAGVIRDAIGTGHFPVGTQLPTVRQLSKDLVVSETTVARAYEFLREQGQIEGKVGSGTYVRRSCDQPSSQFLCFSFAVAVHRRGGRKSVQILTLAPANAYLQRRPFANGLPFSAGLHFRTTQPGLVAGFRSPKSMASGHHKDGL